MRLESSEGFPVPRMPDTLKPYIKGQAANCIISSHEMHWFSEAFDLFLKYTLAHPIPHGVVCNIIYVCTKNIVLEKNSEWYGYNVSLAIVDITELRSDHRLDPSWWKATILEEICHALYLERDEYHVKEMVYDIMKQSDGDHSYDA